MDDYERLFDTLITTWERTRDGARIAEFYHYPLASLRGDGTLASIGTREEAARLFQAAIDRFYGDGYRTWGYADFSSRPLGERAALATLTWIARNDDGGKAAIRQSYLVVRIDRDLKIVSSVIHLGPPGGPIEGEGADASG
jgi:hypothetical protein